MGRAGQLVEIVRAKDYEFDFFALFDRTQYLNI